MPSPQPNLRNQSRERPTYSEQILIQLQDAKAEFRETRKELNQRMDRVETRMDRIESRMDKLDEKIDKLADKIDRLAGKIDSSRNHGQIATISTIGIAIAVIYAVLK